MNKCQVTDSNTLRGLWSLDIDWWPHNEPEIDFPLYFKTVKQWKSRFSLNSLVRRWFSRIVITKQAVSPYNQSGLISLRTRTHCFQAVIVWWSVNSILLHLNESVSLKWFHHYIDQNEMNGPYLELAQTPT